jgi:iron-sulfur cluster repair protein YtfE (RIC family)
MGIATSVKKATRQFEKAITGEEPEVDILDTLKEEHEEVAALLQKLVDGKSTAERKSLLKKIKASLVPHVRAEEKVLYNAILEVKDKAANQDGEEGYMEHGLADKMLATLGKITNAMSPEFGAAAKVLKELVEHHVKEEENAVWSDAKTHFSSEERKQMNQKYLRLKPTIRIP